MRAFHIFLVMAVLLTLVRNLSADERPLHVLIDEQLVPPGGSQSLLCTDADFLRRLSIDLIGMSPSLDEARDFLADQDPQKRIKLIDRLITSPDYDRHFTRSLDVMLMELRGASNVSQDDWHNYLHQSVVQSKPWNVLMREILVADGDGTGPRAAVRFYLDRESEPNLIARDIGRIVFGRDLQCAQCHDHPLIDDYYQSDYQGLYAFFSPGYETKKKVDDKEVTVYAEKAGTDVKFKSVFISETQRITGPRMIDDAVIEEPQFLPGDEYQPTPEGKVWAPPKFSRRTALANAATDGSNHAFNENIANRLWAHVMGRGLVNPVDLHHSSNPPTHPVLMQLLGEKIAAMNFDMKNFVREIVLSNTYQRTIDAPDPFAPSADRTKAMLAQLTQERVAAENLSSESSTTYTVAAEKMSNTESALVLVVEEAEKTRAALVDTQNKLAEENKQLSEAKNKLKVQTQLSNVVGDAAMKAAEARKLLNDDSDLASAADFFSRRAKGLNEEVVTLQETVDTKNTAVKSLTEAVVATTSPAQLAMEKTTPLRNTMRTEQQAEIGARRQMIVNETRLQSLDQRIQSLQKIIAVQTLQQDTEFLLTETVSQEHSIATIHGELEEYNSLLGELDAKQQKATEDNRIALERLHALMTADDDLQQAIRKIVSVINNADVAVTTSSDANKVTDTVNKLKENAADLDVASSKIKESASSAEVAAKVTQQQMDVAAQAYRTAISEQTRQKQALDTAEIALATHRQSLQEKQSLFNEAVTELNSQFTADFTIAGLKPLTPYQLCFSMMRATGVLENKQVAAKAELDKNNPLSEEAQNDPVQMLQRQREIESQVWENSKEHIKGFTQVYGNGAGQPQTDFFATADQALYLANGDVVNAWVTNGSLANRIANESDIMVAGENLYLGLLSRLPTEEENEEVTNYLTARSDDRKIAIQELIWAILNSVEFRFNH